MTILVAIAAARDIVSGGLRSILAEDDDIEVVERFPEFGLVPDVVLYDAIGMEDDEGAELKTLVKDREWAVIVVGRDLRPDLAARALAHGAYGCFSMESDADAILSTVHASVAERTANDGTWPESSHEPGALAELSPREIQVLSGITGGLSNAEICALLNLGHNTMKTYIRTAYRKIDVRTRSQAVAWCLQHGFEPPTDDRGGLRA
ncbi:MAG: response regulator transcription factor [Nocardioides sp.]